MDSVKEEQAEAKSVHNNEQDKSLARKWLNTIKHSKSFWKQEFHEIDRLRKLAADDVEHIHPLHHDETISHKKRVNLIHSTISGLIPHIYAKMPEIAIETKESMSPEDYPYLQGFSRTLELVVNEQLDNAKLKRLAKTAVRKSFSSRVAWAKVLWQQDIKEDPIIIQRIADAQDNILHIDKLIKDLEESTTFTDLDAKRAELKITLDALEDQREVVVSSGLVIDIINPEQILLETHIKEWDRWDQSSWICHIIPMPIEKAKELFPHADFTSNSAITNSVGKSIAQSSTDLNDAVIDIYELWDKSTMSVYTLTDQFDGFLRDPYQPDIISDRWYPFAPLALNITDGRFFPLSLTELLEKLQEEYLETRDKYAEHRSKSIPKTLFDADAVDQKTAMRIVNGEVLEAIPINSNGRGLSSLFDVIRYPPIDPSLYDTNAIRYDVEAVSGLQDAARGGIVTAKTATEASIMQTGLTSRVSEMQDTLEDWIENIAEMAAEMALLALSKVEVAQIAGSKAVWPELDRESIYRKIRVRVRAGTSGKPDKLAQQKSWAQIMPLAMDMLQKITAAELQGQSNLAQAMRELLAEMLRRLDEHFDIDSLLPKQSAPSALPPVPPNLVQPTV